MKEYTEVENGDLSRSFTVFNIAQFFGVLNENVFKLLVILLVGSLPGMDQKHVIWTVSALFVAPFLLFSHAAGVLADRFSKRNVMVVTRFLDIPVMAFGCLGVYLQSSWILYSVLFVACTQAAVFAPAKYGIIPELVGVNRLSKANSYVVGLTYLAIIIGTFFPSLFLVYLMPEKFLALSFVCLAFAVFGFILSLLVEKTPAAGSTQKMKLFFLADLYRTAKFVARDGYLNLTILGSAYFMLIGGFIQQNTIVFGQEYLGLSWLKSAFLFPVAGVGIAVGAVLAGKLSGRSTEFGIVPVGAFGLTFATMLLGTVGLADQTTALQGSLVLLAVVGFSSGIFVVPLNAFIQESSPPDRLGEIQGYASFLGFAGVVLSVGLLYLFQSVLGLSVAQSFVVIGVLTGVLAAVSLVVLPDFLVRFALLIITRCFYRIKTVGLENVPATGPALLVPNHVTWVDAFVLMATQQRRLRFVMARQIYENKWLKPLFKLMQIIPISPSDPPRQVVESLKKARQAMDDGYLLCIFAEGSITRNGGMNPFRSGMEKIVKGSDYKIIPVYIGGAWGSIFSYYTGKLVSTFPKRMRYPIELIFGAPMPAASSAKEVQDAVVDLSVSWYNMKKKPGRSLAHLFVKSARKHWFKQAVKDTTGRSLKFGEVLTGAIALSRELEKTGGRNEKIGVLLPSSVAGVLVNAALTLAGRTSVNLNFTASAESVTSAIRQCDMKTLIVSRAFLEKLEGFPLPAEGVVYIEDIMPAITAGRKFTALLQALFAPVESLCSYRVPAPDDLATVIFSSGSTGEPKGVMLSHHNIISNIESFRTILHLEPQDGMCGILPFFHSFGYTCSMWCPLLSGFPVGYHTNPLDATKIADLVRENKLTVFVATPTFLLAYIRRARKEDFVSLRLIVTGAEKLKTKIADAFEEKFGIRPREGYGATELSPVAALNVPDVMIDGVNQPGTREGSVGQPVPGVLMRVVDPETMQQLPAGQQGLLLIKGANVMTGYLGNLKKTAEVLKDGWYNTGDIAKIDGDGFVFLMDRLSRYSKIGGEMVPHIAVEDKYLQALGAVTPVVYVTSAPDEKKGEQLVVFFTPEAGEAVKLHEIIAAADVPNLWKPKKENYVPIEALPTLGTGKIDQKRLKDLAVKFAAGKAGSVEG